MVRGDKVTGWKGLCYAFCRCFGRPAVALLWLVFLGACQQADPTATPFPAVATVQTETAVLPTVDLAAILPTPTPTPSPLPVVPDTPTPLPEPPASEQSEIAALAAPTCFSTYTLVESFTTPGADLLPGVPFWQTWRVRNDGTCAWDVGAVWLFTGGEQLSGPDLVALPPAGPGQTVDVNVALVAPAAPGVYIGFWQPQMTDGLLLQPPSAVRINVVQPQITNTPAATAVIPVATATAVPPTATAAPTFTGWRGEYFNNQTLSGQPVLVRDDPEINFNWGTSSPGSGLQNGNFSVRWTRSIIVPGGEYRFLARSNDGVRVWVNGVLLFDEWQRGQNATFQSEITLQPGQLLNVRVEYYHATGLAGVHVWAEPQARYPQWRGSYIADPNLQGQPVLIRNDQDINFDWGTGAPASGMPANNFSVIWIRTLPFNSSGYRFYALVDDGMRLYVDGALVIDAWQDGTVRQVSGAITLAAGQHDVTVVYYERLDAAQIQVWWEQVNGFE